VPHPALSKGEGSKKERSLSPLLAPPLKLRQHAVGEDLGEAKFPGGALTK